jgi:hypothetical protein
VADTPGGADVKRNTIHSITIETASVQQDVGRAFAAAATHARRIELVGNAAEKAATNDAFRNAPPDDLEQRAAELRGHALHAVSAAVEMVAAAGRLEQLAEVWRAGQELDAREE